MPPKVRRAIAVMVWVAAPILGLSLLHFAFREDSSLPDLQTDDWRGIRVVYLVEAGTNRVATAWSTEDVSLLRSLRESLHISRVTMLYSVGQMRNNRIDLTLRDDEHWVMAVNKKALNGPSLLVYSPDNPQRSFSMRIDPRFYRALEQAVEAGTGQKVDLDASSINLIGPDAADFRAASRDAPRQ